MLLKDLGAVRRGLVEAQEPTGALDNVMAGIRRSPDHTDPHEYIQPLLANNLGHFAACIISNTYYEMALQQAKESAVRV